MPEGAGSLAPTGSVSFVHGLTVLGSVSLSGGVAQFATTNLALGSHPIHAVYEGGGNFTGSHSGMVSLSVQPDAATVVVSPSANPSPPKASLKLAVTVGAARARQRDADRIGDVLRRQEGPGYGVAQRRCGQPFDEEAQDGQSHDHGDLPG